MNQYDTSEKIAARRAELEEELSALDGIEQMLSSLSPAQRMAIALHSSWCNYNHTDGCSWMYELDTGKHLWSGSAHRRWLNKAQRILAEFPGMTSDEALKMGALFR